jgi:EpsD family peptidyl-prolyl cis-trans isomerase
MKAAQAQAVQQLIMKDLIVQRAKQDKLDKQADYINQVRRGEDALLIQLYQRKIAQSVAMPSRQEGESYVAAHPEKFAERRVLIVDQLIAAPNPKITPERLRPLKTLEEVRALYDAEQAPTQRNVATIDTLTIPPKLLEQINKLPPDDVFIFPERGSLLFNRIVEARPAPFVGDAAVAYAVNTLRAQRAQEAVARQMDVLRKSAEKNITYNEAYKPPPKGAAPKAGAAAPTAAAPAPAAAAPAAAPAPKAP